MPANETYTINEAATLTGLHRNTIRQKVKLGLLEATIQPGKYGDEYRISHDALLRAGLLEPETPGERPRSGEPVMEAEFTDDPGPEADAAADDGRADPTPAALAELFQRHEHAMFRLGYLQAEIERWKALAETAESLREDNAVRNQELESLRAALRDKEREAREAEALRRELERAREQLAEVETLRRDLDQLKELAARQEAAVQELEAETKRRPWWQPWKK